MHRRTDFRIRVSASPESNDHQVRFEVDGADLIAGLWGDMLGLDPDEILTQPCPLSVDSAESVVTVARCSCGVTGCGSEHVTIGEKDGSVTWLSGSRTVLRVDAAAYHSEVARALLDFSWETPDRTAARLFRTRVNPSALRAAGFILEWASGRVRDGRFTASLRLEEEGTYQVLVSIPWRKLGLRRSPAAPDVVADELIVELAKEPTEWAEVEWSPMGQGQGSPRAGGPRWRRLTTC